MPDPEIYNLFGKELPFGSPEFEDYEYFDPFLGDIGPDYGLQCQT